MPKQALAAARILICDLDGTIIDSAPDLTSALGDLLAEVGRPPLPVAAVRRMVGDGIAVLVERALLASGGIPDDGALAGYVARYAAFYEGRMTELTRPYPGAVVALNNLKGAGWRLAICSNKPEKPCRHVLATLGLDGLFEVVAGGDTFAIRKPDPGHVRGVLDRLDARPDEAIMLGDSRNDVLAARGAGLPTIAIASGYGPVPAKELDADVLIETFAELPDALATVAKRANAGPLA
jgi:phosphoglycolate phosphatase